MDDQADREHPDGSATSAGRATAVSRSATPSEAAMPAQHHAAQDDLIYIASVIGDLHTLASTQVLPRLLKLTEALMVAFTAEWPKPRAAEIEALLPEACLNTSRQPDRGMLRRPGASLH